ncbi:hypothetical protein EDC01DRAFT_610830 [Geopyxis carbonaria]|nr:hypothetical protein EDC01DRAFT_610830 [Geopyxis carbonaria]
MPLTTLRESAMMAFMNEVTDKEDWQNKVFDEDIVKQWGKETILEEDFANHVCGFTDAMFDYCIQELQKIKVPQSYGPSRPVTVFDAGTSQVVKSDSAIPAGLQKVLRAAFADLEEVPARGKGKWYPGWDEKVLDLVDPSLYPLVYGSTKVVTDRAVGLGECLDMYGKGEVVPLAADEEIGEYYSMRFQWLPCEVSFVDGAAKITSYINNLHPEHFGQLYTLIEQIIDYTIPLWNLTIPLPLSVTRTDGPEMCIRIPYHAAEYDFPYADLYTPEERDYDEGENWIADLVYEHMERERCQEWLKETVTPIQPEPKPFKLNAARKRARMKGRYKTTTDLVQDFKEEGLQVIVKLASIQLTPEKPEYEGGSWHIEGMLNEHICASAIYYLENTNITPSTLEFRQESNVETANEIAYEQNKEPSVVATYGSMENVDHRELCRESWLFSIFGRQHGDSGLQPVGGVNIVQNRLVTFPNTLQHRVAPFSLEDRTIPGCRKMLALFLVDPHIRIASTAHVMPQQHEWWADRARRQNPVATLPAELAQMVVDAAGGGKGTSAAEARAIREQVVQEREKAAEKLNLLLEEGPWGSTRQFSLFKD